MQKRLKKDQDFLSVKKIVDDGAPYLIFNAGIELNS